MLHYLNNSGKITLVLITILVCIALFLFWNFYNPVSDFKPYVPGMDKSVASSAKAKPENIEIGKYFKKSSEFKPFGTGKWPGFRGADSDNILKTEIKLNTDWNKKMPAVKWSLEMGEGHAAPAIYNGLVYILDYDEQERADALKCISLENGKEIWKRWYKVKVKRNHGRSRTVPAVTEKYVVSVGPRCHVMCCNRITGDLIWSIDMEKEYGTETPFWYTGQCPIVYDSTVVLAPCGKILAAGIHIRTGKTMWQIENNGKKKMSHASVTFTEVHGQKMFVYPSIGGITAFFTDKNGNGVVLWEYNRWTPSVIAPSALKISENRLLFSAGYGAGSLILELTYNNNAFGVKEVDRILPAEGIASEQQTQILFNGSILSIQPKDAGAYKNQLVCYNPKDCRKAVWSSGKKNRFGLGPYFIINENIFILNDDGELTLARPEKDEFVILHKNKFFDGEDSWGPLAFADGFLLLRDSKHLFCLDIRL